MRVSSILRDKGHKVIHVAPTARVPEISQVLHLHNIGAVLVMDRVQTVIGIVSERDLVRALNRHGAEVLSMTAGQLMTQPVHTIAPTATLDAVMQLMTTGRIRHLPVVSENTLLGMISIGDVVKARSAEQDTEVESLRTFVSGGRA